MTKDLTDFIIEEILACPPEIKAAFERYGPGMLADAEEMIHGRTGMSEQQMVLKGKHGTPDEFEQAVWRAYADLLVTHEEAVAAIGKYREEWIAAGQEQLG